MTIRILLSAIESKSLFSFQQRVMIKKKRSDGMECWMEWENFTFLGKITRLMKMANGLYLESVMMKYTISLRYCDEPWLCLNDKHQPLYFLEVHFIMLQFTFKTLSLKIMIINHNFAVITKEKKIGCKIKIIFWWRSIELDVVSLIVQQKNEQKENS